MFIGPTLAASAQRVLKLIDVLAQAIPAERAPRFATGANGPIESNHPVFVYGHLAIYAPKLIQLAGGTTGSTPVPTTWETLFAKGVACLDDLDRTRYPALSELVASCRAGYRQGIAVLETASDDLLAEPTPNEALRKAFPTRAVACNFLLNDHTMFHLGQVSAWRRMEGLGSAL